MNEEIIQNAFSEYELRHGFSNMDGPTGRILSSNFIHKIKHLIDFNEVNVVLDIGSRDGCQSLELSRYFPLAHIYAFEPNPDALPFVENNARQCSRIKVIQSAVSQSSTPIPFYKVVNGNIGASSIYKTSGHSRSAEWQQVEIEVPSTRIDEWAVLSGLNSIDIVWADVQGAELDVFSSFGKYLSSVKCIATEVALEKLYNGSTLLPELDELLSGFIRISFEPEATRTEADVIYVNRNLYDQ